MVGKAGGMTIRYTKTFLKSLKKRGVILRKAFKKTMGKFGKDPNDPELNNHELRKEWVGHRSIEVMANWRAIYKEKSEGDEKVTYFMAIGTHEELYG